MISNSIDTVSPGTNFDLNAIRTSQDILRSLGLNIRRAQRTHRTYYDNSPINNYLFREGKAPISTFLGPHFTALCGSDILLDILLEEIVETHQIVIWGVELCARFFLSKSWFTSDGFQLAEFNADALWLLVCTKIEGDHRRRLHCSPQKREKRIQDFGHIFRLRSQCKNLATADTLSCRWKVLRYFLKTSQPALSSSTLSFGTLSRGMLIDIRFI